MTELVFFIIVGAVAVAAAVMMLLSDNAVHSALFLIITMGSLAFLFLLLNAPFLAMIQITVYAGAIMVLFLFVIMLLGAEKIRPPEPTAASRRYPWFTPVALMLGLSLLIAVGLVITQSQVDLLEEPAAPPQIRVVNATLDIPSLSLYANDVLLAAELPFGATSEFVTVPAGDVALKLTSDGQPLNEYPIEPNTVQTIIAFGPGDVPVLAPIPTDLSQTSSDRAARLTVFNAYPAAPSASLWDLGSDFSDEDNYTIVPPLAFGALSPSFSQREGRVTWTFVPDERVDRVLYRMLNYRIERGEDTLLILAEQRLADGTTRPDLIGVRTPAAPAFGSPRAIGEQLFVEYLLPFQLLAVLLLAAMVGAILLTHRELGKAADRVTGRRRVSRPLTNVIAAQVGHDVTDTPTPGGAPAAPASDPAGD
jgi:NADH:ubiquinone oxidoreductase subunit 6 (subunit J)